MSGGKDALGIYSGISSGSPVGYASAAINAGKLTNQISGQNTIPGVGAAGDALGIYSGIARGGVAGYGSAALSAYDLYNTASAIGSAGSAGATAGSAAVTSAGSSAAAGAGSTAASTFGSYLPVVGMLLSAYMDSQAPTYTLSPSWYQKVNSALSAGPGPTVDKSSPDYYGTPAEQQQAYNYFAALGSVQGEKGYEHFSLPTLPQPTPGTYSGGPGGKSRSANKA